MQADRLISNATSGCQNSSVIATLLITSTHLLAIGRPGVWLASAEFVSKWGQSRADQLLWVGYSCNAMVEAGSLLLLLYCTFGRVLLVYILPSKVCVMLHCLL